MSGRNRPGKEEKKEVKEEKERKSNENGAVAAGFSLRVGEILPRPFWCLVSITPQLSLQEKIEETSKPERKHVESGFASSNTKWRGTVVELKLSMSMSLI